MALAIRLPREPAGCCGAAAGWGDDGASPLVTALDSWDARTAFVNAWAREAPNVDTCMASLQALLGWERN